jgi:hypothetical protein
VDRQRRQQQRAALTRPPRPVAAPDPTIQAIVSVVSEIGSGYARRGARGVWGVIGAIAEATEKLPLTTAVTCPTLRIAAPDGELTMPAMHNAPPVAGSDTRGELGMSAGVRGA